MKDRAAEQLIGDYLQRATRRLWGRERGTVREELESHIRTRIAAHRLAGLCAADAVRRTLAELGEPEVVNDGMARLYVIPAAIGTGLRVAFRQFRTRRLESLLIVFALALGVGVITAVAAFLGISDQAEGLLKAPLSSREIMVLPAANDGSAFSGPDARLVMRTGRTEESAVSFTLADLEEFRASAPTVAYAYTRKPDLIASPSAAASNSFLTDAFTAFGVTPDFFAAAGIELEVGSFFSSSDYQEGRPLLLLTRETLAQRRVTGDPVGQPFFAGRLMPEFTILGVVKDSTNVRRDAGYYPIDPKERHTYLYFAVDDPRLVPQARAELQAYAQQRWGDSVVISAQPRLRQLTDVQRLGAWVVAAFASVGLLVASLNIMNLMLARMLKGSRALGILRSLGASRAAIRKQILTESGLLGALGGVTGIGVGYLLLLAYNRNLETASGGVLQGVAFSPLAVVLGVSLAIAASLLFGLYPAFRASSLRIVEVLGES
jgi:putative ABC transport system permease protein